MRADIEDAFVTSEDLNRTHRGRSTHGSVSGSIGLSESLDNLSEIFRRKHLLRKRHSLQPTPYITLRFMESSFEEIVSVRRGMTFRQAALPLFEANVLDFGAYDFYLDGSNSPLPINAHSELLGGCIIYVVKKSNLHLKNEMSERKKRSSTGSSFSTAKKSAIRIPHAGSLQQLIVRDADFIEMPSYTLPRIKSQPNPIQRLSRMLSPSKERLDRLSEALHAFETVGIPTRFSTSDVDSKFQVKSKWLYLERSWENIVQEPEKLSQRDKIQQSVIWELLCTEANYLRNLKSVVDVHLATLIHLQNSGEKILCEVDARKMFSNFEDIYVANGLFWKRHLYRLLKNTRKTGVPLDVWYLYEGFMNISQQFSPYISFCIDTNECRKYVQLKKEGDPMFAKLLRWADCKISSDSNKEGLKDQLSKPFQRLMRYKLLLDRVKDETSDPEQYRMLVVMVDRVAMFVQDVDDRVAASQKFEALIDLSKQIDYFIPPDTAGEEFVRFSDKYPSFNLLLPMPYNNNYREIIYEGSLKYRDNLTKWTDVHAILFTDMFLVGKSNKKGMMDRIKVFRPPIKLEKIFVEKYCDTPQQYLLYILDDFGYLRTITVISGNPKKLAEWVNKIQVAKTQLMEGAIGIDRRKLPETLVREYGSMSSTEISSSSTVGDRLAPTVTQTLSVTDMRRRFQASASSENSFRQSPSNSHSSIDLALAEECEVGSDDAIEESTVRLKTRFLRTASPQNESSQNMNNPDTVSRYRRGSRGDRRYRTADSVIPVANLPSSSIHKRFSLNYGRTVDEPRSSIAQGHPATSVESFQSSSGFSSAGSVQCLNLHFSNEINQTGRSDTDAIDSNPFEIDKSMDERSASRISSARHCMSLNDLSRLHLHTISDINDYDDDSLEGNISNDNALNILKQYVLVHSSDGEVTDV